jgi:hypothetical protein
MNTAQPLAVVSAAGATIANLSESLPLEKVAAAVAILAGLASAAVSIRQLLAKPEAPRNV